MGWPFGSSAKDVQLPNEFGRSPENPAPELKRRRAAAKEQTPDVLGALQKAAGGVKTLSDKGLVSTRKMSR